MPKRLIERIWESSSLPARIARAALVPPAAFYAAAVALRNRAYDRNWIRARVSAIPVIAVGNLTVGGTGKTPVAAYVAARLAAGGAKPALVMRGYGDDEMLVHRLLNPNVEVIVDADRARGVETAHAHGATVAVLDDGFQHRRARRDADIVLLSADLSGPVRPLPAGPWRESLRSLVRATVIVVTRKSASTLRAKELLGQAQRFAPRAAGAIIYLAPDQLVRWASDETRARDALRFSSVLAIAGIGDPRAFESQLKQLGAIVDLAAASDHHRYSAAEATALAKRAAAYDLVVCTLKDAVKLGPLWPAEAPPLWYLSQRVEVESGAELLERILADLAAGT